MRAIIVWSVFIIRTINTTKTRYWIDVITIIATHKFGFILGTIIDIRHGWNVGRENDSKTL